MSRNLALSITARTESDVIHYEYGRGRSCVSTNEDHGRCVIGTWDGGDLEEVDVLEWWNGAPD